MFDLSLRGTLTWLALALYPGLVNAQEPLRKIAVTAAITNEFPVTNVDYRLTVRMVRPTLVEAKKEVDTAVAKFRQRLSVFPADTLVIQTPALDQGRDYKYERDEKKFQGFFVERTVTIELKDYALLDRLEAILCEYEDFTLSSRSFSHKDLIKLRHDARKSALEAAKRKASSMAEVLDMKIGMPLEISEGGWHSGGSTVGPSLSPTLNIPFTQGGFTEGPEVKNKNNTITISADVSVVFELKPGPGQ